MSEQLTPEPYRVLIAASAKRAALDLPQKIFDAVDALVRGPLAAEPKRVGKPLREPLDGLWSARRGTYRIIYRIDDADRSVTILDVDRRGDVYRNH